MAEIVTSTLSCEQTRELLAVFCRGETDEGQSLGIKAHLGHCQTCRESFFREAAREFFQEQDAARDRATDEGNRGIPRDLTLLFGEDRMPVPKRKGRVPASCFSKHDFPFALSKCESVREILEWLLSAAGRSGLKNVRYHFFSPSDGRLVSVDGVGHRPEIEARLRRGRILRRPTSALPGHCDSYICFYHDRPVVFQIDDTAEGLVEMGRVAGGLPHFRLDRDHCENVLMGPSRRIWVDVPMAAMGRFVGKLSCDLAATELASLDARQIHEFWQCAQIAAPCLDGLYASTVNDAFEAVRERIDACENVDQLRAYLTGPLARDVLGCRYANLFSVSQDIDGHRLLVLDKTTCPWIQGFQERKAYRWASSEYSIPWVARNQAGLRMNDLLDLELREEQCKVYEADFNWEDPLIDWSRISSQLAAPILACKDQVVGVIQFLDKRARRGGEDGAFTDGELTLLDRLGRELIGSRLHSLRMVQNTA